MPENAGMWLRVSSTGQDEENQRPDNDKWCADRDYAVAAEHVYTIHGKSAFKGNKRFDRTWAQVIADMEAGAITVLVVWKTDRMDRKLQTFQMLEEVVKAGGRVEFVTEAHLNDLTTMGSRIALKVQEEIAHAESQTKSDRMHAVNATIRANGGNIGRAPWGYVSSGPKYGKLLVATDECRRLAPQVFESIKDGESTTTVAHWLYSETGHKWWARSVWAMIRNPAYRGHRVNAKGVTVGRAEAVVDADVWLAANRTLDARKGGRRGPRHDEHGMLTSVHYCGDCADNGLVSKMYRVKGGDATRQTRPVYYRCDGKPGIQPSCGLMVRADVTDATVTDWLSMAGRPHTEPRRIDGSSYLNELAEVELELIELPKQGLSRDQEMAERVRLWQLQDELGRMIEKPTRVERVETGMTVGEHFRSLPPEGRRAWMLKEGVKVYSRRGMASAIEFPGDSEPG